MHELPSEVGMTLSRSTGKLSAPVAVDTKVATGKAPKDPELAAIYGRVLDFERQKRVFSEMPADPIIRALSQQLCRSFWDAYALSEQLVDLRGEIDRREKSLVLLKAEIKQMVTGYPAMVSADGPKMMAV